MYTIKAIRATSFYQDVIYTQDVLLQNEDDLTVWIEDNEMQINNTEIGKILTKSNYLRAHINGIYNTESEIPENMRTIAYKCEYLDDQHIMLDGFVYQTSDKLDIASSNKSIWVCIFLRDLK
jgi:hypothetical protein